MSAWPTGHSSDLSLAWRQRVQTCLNCRLRLILFNTPRVLAFSLWQEVRDLIVVAPLPPAIPDFKPTTSVFGRVLAGYAVDPGTS